MDLVLPDLRYWPDIRLEGCGKSQEISVYIDKMAAQVCYEHKYR